MRFWSLLFSITFVMLCYLAGSLHSAPDQDSEELNLQSLLQRIQQLEKRVQQLEAIRPAVVPPQPPQLLLQPPGKTLLAVPRQPAAPPIPGTWKRKQINGIEYYILPLETNQK